MSLYVPQLNHMNNNNAVIISDNTYLDDISFSSPLTVDKDYFLALVNGNSYSFSKELLVNGSLFVGDINSYGNGFSTTFDGLTITNNGLIVVDSRNLTTGSMIVSWGGSSITNNGRMYFNGLNSSANSFTLNPSISLTNTGLMSFGQDSTSDYSSVVHLKSGSFVNIGTICLKNVKASLESSIAGDGCITIGENSVYAIPIQSSSGTVGPQTIYMTSPSSMLYVGSYGNTDNIFVRGFGNGNYLTFRTAIAGYNYDPDTGILTVDVATIHKINIGIGYNPHGFSMKSINNHIGFNFINNALVYNGTAPNGFPSACMPCDSPPWIPIINSISSSSSSFSSTYSSISSSYSTSSIPSTVGSSSFITSSSSSKPKQITSYIPGIIGSASAQSTITSYTTDANGSSSEVDIVVVATPVQSTVTAYTAGSVGAASALSSYISYTTDSNGSTKAIGVVVVETPAVSQITSYIPGIIGSASAQSTITSYTTDANGSTKAIGVVVVATPVQSTVTAYTAGSVGAASALSSYISYTTDSNGSTKAIGVIVVETPIYGNSTIYGGETGSTLTGTLVVLTTVVNGVTMTTTYCPEPSETSKTSMTAIIVHNSIESVYSKNQQEETNSFAAVFHATSVTSIAFTTTGTVFTNNENQSTSRNSRGSAIVVGSTKGNADVASETGVVTGAVTSGRPETSLTTKMPQVSQFVSEQFSSSPTAMTASHVSAPSLASYKATYE
ncbi:hypothetical protein RI543_005079 [Arxiozyma heterogenica]|uniref:Hyphally-regulated cell wall protein N-terminal domain-containing protein n=1 Tax=Arxiozyma heterogenica TaxID=278026 RepID=A0AAN7WL06_9SACH|nr:hypothetical protein RI543_005079 [Kazachstania heterogenica]